MYLFRQAFVFHLSKPSFHIVLSFAYAVSLVVYLMFVFLFYDFVLHL